MVPDAVVNLANLLQLSVPIIGLLAYVPQSVRLFTTHDSEAIPLRAWGIWTLSGLCALNYAVVQLLLTGRGSALVLSAGVELIFVAATLILIIRFRPRSPPAPAAVGNPPVFAPAALAA